MARNGKHWWDGLNLGSGGTRQLSSAEKKDDHFERCPFCGQVFDMRDLGQVLTHYDCQLAASEPASDLTPKEDEKSRPGEVVPLDRKPT